MKYTNKSKFAFILLVILVGSIYIQASVNKTFNHNYEVFEVADKLIDCKSRINRKCMQVKRVGENNFKPFTAEIENFAYIEGYKYFLKVEIETDKNSTTEKFYLKEIISRTEIAQTNLMSNIYGEKWILQKINGLNIKGGDAFLLFNEKEKSFSGYSGCNNMGGNFTADGGNIKFSAIRQTKRACQFMQNVEFPFTSALNKVDGYKIKGRRLYLMDGVNILLELEKDIIEK